MVLLMPTSAFQSKSSLILWPGNKMPFLF